MKKGCKNVGCTRDMYFEEIQSSMKILGYYQRVAMAWVAWMVSCDRKKLKALLEWNII